MNLCLSSLKLRFHKCVTAVRLRQKIEMAYFKHGTGIRNVNRFNSCSDLFRSRTLDVSRTALTHLWNLSFTLQLRVSAMGNKRHPVGGFNRTRSGVLMYTFYLFIYFPNRMLLSFWGLMKVMVGCVTGTTDICFFFTYFQILLPCCSPMGNYRYQGQGPTFCNNHFFFFGNVL